MRPPPARPGFAVEPLRTRREASKPGIAYRVTLAAWVAVAVVFAGLAAVVALEYDAVRSALESAVQSQSSGARSAEVSDTVTVTLFGSAGVAVAILLVAGVGLAMASAGRAASIAVLLVAGLAAIGASILFWSFMSDTGSIAAGALQWGPLVAAGFGAVATVSGCVRRRS